MQVKSVEYEVFTFADVMADVNLKSKVLEKYRDINVDYEWWQWTEDEFHEILKIIGFWNIESNFSGFGSQGDGASFSGKYSYEKGCLAKIKAEYPDDTNLHDIVWRLVREQKLLAYKYRCVIKTRGNYCHEYTMSIETDSDYATEAFYDKLIAAEDEFLDIFRDLAKYYYRRLEREHEYLTSDEVVLECLKGNGYEFKSNGSIFQTK